jgi:hypothetical protein
MEHYRVTLTFTEPLLGTTPLDKEVYTSYIQSRGTDNADELDTLTNDEAIEKGTTGFHLLDGMPILYDYVLKGFFKDACGMLRRDKQSGSGKLLAFKKVIDGLMFVKPRQIPIAINGETGILERPLRAQTAQGERVALARSVSIPAGSSITFDLLVISGVTQTLLEEWLTYGALRGLGQWRNAGWGSFSYELSKIG